MSEVLKQYIKDKTGKVVNIIRPEQQIRSKEIFKNNIAGMNEAYNVACHYYFQKGH
jgi:hypothetical protein